MFQNGGFPSRFAVADPIKKDCVIAECIGQSDEVFVLAVDNSSTANAVNDFTIVTDQVFDIRGRCNLKVLVQPEIKTIVDLEFGFTMAEMGRLIRGRLDISFDGEDYLWVKRRLGDVLVWPVYDGGVIGRVARLGLMPGRRISDERYLCNPIVVTDETTFTATIFGLPTPIQGFQVQLFLRLFEGSTVPKTYCHLIPLFILDEEGIVCRMDPK